MSALPAEARSFVDKWLRDEPEMDVALGFEPAATRDLAACWGALQHEIFDTAIHARDTGVAQVKLAWWGETLGRGAPQGAAHPLVRALHAHPAAADVPPAAWQAWIRAAHELGAEEDAPSDVAAALALRQHWARAAVSIELRLFDLAPDDAGQAATQASAVGLLLRQLRGALQGRTARVPLLPLQLVARHGLRRAAEPDADDPAQRAAFADLAQALAAAMPGAVRAPRQRRCRVAFDRRLLHALASQPGAAHTQLPRLRALWTAWRAARAAQA